MERLRELREARKVTQSQLGEYIGAKKSAISLWETGKRQPDQDTLVRLASYFDVTVDYLLGREEQPVPAQEKAPADDPLAEQIMHELKGADVELSREVLNFIRFRKSGGN